MSVIAVEGDTTESTTTALSARGIRVVYGGVIALSDVSISVRRGEVLGVIGPNGAGKTTLIDAISGFVKPAAGTVVVGSTCLDGMKPFERARSGLVRTFQQLELFDDLTVAENIAVAQHATGRGSPETFQRAVTVTGVSDVLDQKAADLSQGRRRLVALARAIASDPSILLLDEPAAGLDTDESVELGSHIRRLADDGAAVVLVDHDMSLVLTVCDAITVTDFGLVIAHGTPAEIRRNDAVLRAYLGDA